MRDEFFVLFFFIVFLSMQIYEAFAAIFGNLPAMFILILVENGYKSFARLFCFDPLLRLGWLTCFTPPDASAIFLHRKVLYDNIKFVTGGVKNTGAGQKRSKFTMRNKKLTVPQATS